MKIALVIEFLIAMYTYHSALNIYRFDLKFKKKKKIKWEKFKGFPVSLQNKKFDIIRKKYFLD